MRGRLAFLFIPLALIAAACGGDDGDSITVYSGRSEELIAPLIEQFAEATGINVEVRYGDSGELAATILEEGANSPADVFFAQDPASLGAVAEGGQFATLDDRVLGQVSARFSDSAGAWVGVSGRARVVVFDTTELTADELPIDESAFTNPEWRGRIAIAPTNGSFLAFVAAKILLDGEPATLEWLRGMAANEAPTYPKNSAIVAAVDSGEVEAGLVNHYYLFRRIAEEGDVVAANHFLSGDSAASLVMPAGAGILASSDKSDAASRFIDFLLSADAQAYFATETYEYPLAAGVDADPSLPPLDTIETPNLDLSRLAEMLDRATDLVAEAGLL
ncbi:MAG: iron ABC transporter substrate-binding protein [Acidimicrobiia bacterium]|nr:iron ABC transporter substrate-binding protein [Acidimicrobiia bacterium]